MYINIGEIRTHYIDEGKGPFLVLLHGWGANVTLFQGIVDRTKGQFRVLAPDLPGFGESSEPFEPYDLDAYVDFVREFVKATADGGDAPEIIFLGHSHGGRIILRMLSRMADGEDFGFTVPKAILTGSAGLVHEKSPEVQARVKRYKTYKKLLTGTGIAKAFPGTMDALQKKFGSADYAASSPVMRQSMVKVVNTDLREELPKITIPVLLIWGDQDTETPLSDGQTMEQLMPEAGLAVIPGTGHYCYLENPAHYLAILRSFLEMEQ